MIYNKPEIYEALNAILPTYYEQIVDANTETPCITYVESGNYDDTEPVKQWVIAIKYIP